MIYQGYIQDIKSAFIRSAFLFFRLLRGMLGAVLTMGPLTLTWDWDRFVPYLGTHARSQSQTNRRDCPPGPLADHPAPQSFSYLRAWVRILRDARARWILSSSQKGKRRELGSSERENRIIHLSLGHRKKNISLSLQADEENSSI